MPYNKMVDSFTEYFTTITFEQIPRVNNKEENAMATIGFLLDIPQNISKYEFLVEQFFIPTFKTSESKLVCVVIGLESPWYQDTYSYIQNFIMPPHLTSTQRKIFIHRTS